MTISNCGKDEHGKYSGGQAGDQTGAEYWLINWYAGGWTDAWVHPDPKVREEIADCATMAAKNDRIGYDQSERLTFYNKLKAAGWYPEKITQNCEADCSSSSAACVIASGHRCGNAKLQSVNPSCTTWTIGAALAAAGFVKLTASKYLTSDAYLPKGTVLNRSSGHVVIVTTDGSNAAETLRNIGALAEANTAPAYSGKLAVDGYWGVMTTSALQRALGTPVDGIVSDQYVGYKAKNPGLDASSWEWHQRTSAGSTVVRALQRKVGAAVDGVAGNETFSKLQAYLGTTVDGVISSPSVCVKELQRRLNAGSF